MVLEQITSIWEKKKKKEEEGDGNGEGGRESREGGGKKNLNQYLLSCAKLTSKWITDLNVKFETIKLLKKP